MKKEKESRMRGGKSFYISPECNLVNMETSSPVLAGSSGNEAYRDDDELEWTLE